MAQLLTLPLLHETLLLHLCTNPFSLEMTSKTLEKALASSENYTEEWGWGIRKYLRWLSTKLAGGVLHHHLSIALQPTPIQLPPPRKRNAKIWIRNTFKGLGELCLSSYSFSERSIVMIRTNSQWIQGNRQTMHSSSHPVKNMGTANWKDFKRHLERQFGGKICHFHTCLNNCATLTSPPP